MPHTVINKESEIESIIVTKKGSALGHILKSIGPSYNLFKVSSWEKSNLEYFYSS